MFSLLAAYVCSRSSKTTAEQPWGLYDIEFYESPYETFYCIDYGVFLSLFH